MKAKPEIAVFFHNYYGNHHEWIRLFSENIKVPFTLFYNIVENSSYNFNEEDQSPATTYPTISEQEHYKIIFRRSSNQGKDIGGKMVLLDTYLRLQTSSNYIIFIHDKTSPYKIQNKEWRKKLLRIIEPDFVQKASGYFEQNKNTGIITSEDSIDNEYDHSLQNYKSNNREQLLRLQAEYGIINNNDYNYVAGTMFWVRTLPLLNFFKKHHPLDIRKSLETGNISDTIKGSNTHAWERLLSWLIISQGYGIKGIR